MVRHMSHVYAPVQLNLREKVQSTCDRDASVSTTACVKFLYTKPTLTLRHVIE